MEIFLTERKDAPDPRAGNAATTFANCWLSPLSPGFAARETDGEVQTETRYFALSWTPAPGGILQRGRAR